MMQKIARGLGWFSLGLGLGGVAAPGGLARLIGVSYDDRSRMMLRAVGMREIGHGVAILRQRNPTGGVWSRVAGDTMDLAYVGSRFASADARRRDRLMAALGAVAGIAVLDLVTAVLLTRGTRGDRGIQVRKSITVRRPPAEVYGFWRDFQNLPTFMRHLESVQVMGDRRSRWKAQGPAGKTVEWDAEIVEDRPGELIAWRSLERSEVQTSGRVRFVPAPGGRGTEIHVELRYDPPMGRLGATVAKLFGKDAEQEVYGDLRRFKQVLETGEVVLSEGTLTGAHFPQHPASPPKNPITSP